MKKIIALLTLAAASLGVQAVDLVSEAPYGVDFGPMTATWLNDI
jgi:hypothetical protein